MKYKLTAILKIHNSWIKSLDIDPYDALLASSSMDGTTRIVDIGTKQLLATIPLKSVCEEIKFSKIHPYTFCALLDGLIKCYDLVDREFIREYYGHMSSVLCLDTYDRRIFSGSSDCTVRVWDIRARNDVSVMKGHSLPVTHVMFDNGFIYSCSMDGSVRLWDERSNSTAIAAFPSSVTSMCTCGGSLFVSTGKKVFECKDGSYEIGLGLNALSLGSYSDSHYLVGSEKCIFIKSRMKGGPDYQLETAGPANVLKTTANKEKIISGGVDKNIEFLEKDQHI
ncbi:putative WD40 domain-containing protein [Encephalitozoon intestinalis ATCC 50506]|uniref:WD40 domain-containing protein n=1 Tax=Encephalitozoon intestinalis (strain ATCC 50506) TaxID=876142 RepID=E0SA64_ENCIT|nr:putative WD40 domain-containing protein [Encephalitozoon intestinalis ATCC 50506]ADM12686.1 putative WD40 domain-containing protein [Encephalitozoon intestinalis ATCC 50506]UTX46548.1 WD40 domain-containing protein [Encephalitozoon intestinalis]